MVTKKAAKTAPAARPTAKRAPKPQALESTPRVDGRRLRGEATRGKILRAAREIINETGRPALVHDVATRSGIARRTVYHPDVETLTRHALALRPRKRLRIVRIIEPADIEA